MQHEVNPGAPVCAVGGEATANLRIKGVPPWLVVYPQPRDWQICKIEWKAIRPKIKLSR